MENGKECVVIAKFTCKKDGREDFLNWMNNEIFPDTRTRQGCISIFAYTHSEDDDQVVFIEEWESEKHHKDYIKTREEDGTIDKILNDTEAFSVRYVFENEGE